MATLPDRLKGAMARMDEGRIKVLNKIRTLCNAPGKEVSKEEQGKLIDRKDALVLLKQQPGWNMVLERVAMRKDQVFVAWVRGASEKDADMRARVAELEDLLQWIEGEIAAGMAAEKALLEGEK